MIIERIVELEQFIEREMKGNEALTNDAGCVARAKVDRDILACLKELKAHREAWDGMKEGLLEMSRLHEYVSIKHMIQLIDGIRPKEGDTE